MRLEIWVSGGECEGKRGRETQLWHKQIKRQTGRRTETSIIWRVLVYLLGLLTQRWQLLLFMEPAWLCPANKKGHTIYRLEWKYAPFQSTNKMSGYHSIMAYCLRNRLKDIVAQALKPWINKWIMSFSNWSRQKKQRMVCGKYTNSSSHW